MQRLHLFLLFRLVFAGGVLTAVVVAGSGQQPRSCNAGKLAVEINVLAIRDDPVTAADRASESCAVVRSGVDSSLAATGDVTPCLCLLEYYGPFLFTALCIEDVPNEIYAPCGGLHVEEAQLLAARCKGIIHPPTAPSPSPSDNKAKGGAVPRVDAISTSL